MTESKLERLYSLLPAIYRIRDFEKGEPLRALLAVAESEGLETIERDIDASYRNWFIETCEAWIVPYIADLLGVRNVQALTGDGLPSLRAYVANTLAYRRRKGTAAVLEQLAWDVAGWRACVVEFFQLLGATQHTNHVRPSMGGTACLRNASMGDLVNGPFEDPAHTVEVRRAKAGGHYRIPTIGLSVWRLQSYPVKDAEARAEGAGRTWRGFRFSPLGLDVRLFTSPRPEAELSHIAEEINLPCALRRWALFEELEARRQALVDGEDPEPTFFGEHPVLEISIDGALIPPEEIAICNLEDWRLPSSERAYAPTSDPHCLKEPPSDPCPVPRDIQAAVDPELGRITFAFSPSVNENSDVRVSYAYGFSGDVGAGPYDRRASVEEWLPAKKESITFQIGVTRSQDTSAQAELVETIQAAIDAWKTHVDTHQGETLFGIIAIMDSSTYFESLTSESSIEIPAKCTLAIVAADWPGERAAAGSATILRKAGGLVPDELLPHVLGDISVKGVPNGDDSDPGELILDGLLIEGRLTVLGGDLGRLRVRCCTLVPDPEREGLLVNTSTAPDGGMNAQLEVDVVRSISGPVKSLACLRSLRLEDAVVKASDGSAIEAPGSPVRIIASTVLGECEVRSLEASDSIFEKRLAVERTQVGCVRFSYVAEPLDETSEQPSRTPRRYRCQPDLALASSDLSESEKRLIRARVTPAFTSRVYGHSGFAQLARGCADEIRTGAESGSEMGAFSHLMQPQREANLRAALNEYLPFGMEIALDYET